MDPTTDTTPVTRVVDTADVLRALPYHSPSLGWHGHGQHLVPTDGCAACAFVREQQSPPPTGVEGGE